MKKLLITAILITSGITLMVSCGDGIKRDPGRVYMPDMAYSRAYETYAERDSNVFTTDTNKAGRLIFYNNMPVHGTVSRSVTPADIFPLPKDSVGSFTNYEASKAIPNPEPQLTAAQLKETERIYLINCGICHGTKLDGNGPLYNGGEGPFIAAPKNLASDPLMLAMPDGQMFYSITYGRNTMGSYASQLTVKQRWQIIHYIRSVQKGSAATAEQAAAQDSAVVASVN